MITKKQVNKALPSLTSLRKRYMVRGYTGTMTAPEFLGSVACRIRDDGSLEMDFRAVKEARPEWHFYHRYEYNAIEDIEAWMTDCYTTRAEVVARIQAGINAALEEDAQ